MWASFVTGPCSEFMNLYRRLILIAVLALLSAACGATGEKAKAPPKCPIVGILDDAARVRYFADPASPDLNMLAYDVELRNAALISCEWRADQVVSKIRFEAAARIGPGASSDTLEFPMFIALIDPDSKPLAKVPSTETVKFTKDKPFQRFAREVKDIYITPEDDEKSGEYEILLGIQLTRAQLEFNRSSARQPAHPDIKGLLR